MHHCCLLNLGSLSQLPKDELGSINEAQIKGEYCSLTNKIICKLDKVNIDLLKYNIKTLFAPEKVIDVISSSSRPFEIFEQLTTHHFWSFSEINKLSELASLHIKDGEIKKAIEEYKGNLMGYKTCNLIWEKINFDSMQQERDDELEHAKHKICSMAEEKDPSYYNVIAVRKKLVVTLLEGEGGRHVKVSDLCLLYLEEVFEKMKQTFNLTLDGVLKQVTTGCVEITWYIPSISAWKILNKLPESLQFLREEGISTMFMEDVLIFSDARGVINSKVNK